MSFAGRMKHGLLWTKIIGLIIQLNTLYEWSIQKDQYGLAVSNPKFEYWLLLHFEDGNGIKSSRDCSDRLKQHIPSYNKEIQPDKFHSGIKDAIRRAEFRDTPSLHRLAS